MPRYDYRCTSCGDEFELTQTFSEAGKGTCPVCSGAGQRVFHAVPVIYKGSGFYTTDYGRPKQPAENGSKEDTSAKESKTASKDGASSSADSKSTSSETSSTPSSSSPEGKSETSAKASSKTENKSQD